MPMFIIIIIIREREGRTMIRKSNSSFGNWAVDVSATEIEFFHTKRAAVAFVQSIGTDAGLAAYRAAKDARYREDSWAGR